MINNWKFKNLRSDWLSKPDPRSTNMDVQNTTLQKEWRLGGWMFWPFLFHAQISPPSLFPLSSWCCLHRGDLSSVSLGLEDTAPLSWCIVMIHDMPRHWYARATAVSHFFSRMSHLPLHNILLLICRQHSEWGYELTLHHHSETLIRFVTKTQNVWIQFKPVASSESWPW